MASNIKWAYPPIGFVMNVALGTIYSWSVFRLPLEHLFGWTAFESGLPFTVFLALFGLTMPVGGRVMGRLGPKKTALSGAVLVGFGWILARFVEFTPMPLAFMLLFYGVLAGVGVGLVYGVPIAVSSKWIPERKGLATGITILGFGLSPLITAITAAYLIRLVGVLQTFLYLGVAFAVLLVLLSLPLKFPTTNQQPSASAGAKRGVAYAELTSSQMVRTLTFAGLWLTYVFGTTGGFIAISLSAKYGCDICGLTTAAAATATAVFAVFNGLGRPTFGYLCDRVAPRTIAMLSFGIIVLAAFIATGATTVPLYLVSFALLWFSFGGWLAIAPAVTSTFFGLRNVGSNYGIVFTAYGIGAIVGPLAASYIYGVTHSYAPAFMTTVILALIGVVVAFFTYRPPESIVH
jgi:MFS family permease